MDILLFLLVFPVSIAAIITLVLLICKRYKASLHLAIPTLIIALICVLSGVIFLHQTYGWFQSLEKDVMKNHPAVYKMEMSQKMPQLSITCYTKTTDKADIDSTYEEIKSYILSEEGERKIRTAVGFSIFIFFNINIGFISNENNDYIADYASLYDTNPLNNFGFQKWSETDNSYNSGDGS